MGGPWATVSAKVNAVSTTAKETCSMGQQAEGTCLLKGYPPRRDQKNGGSVFFFAENENTPMKFFGRAVFLVVIAPPLYGTTDGPFDPQSALQGEPFPIKNDSDFKKGPKHSRPLAESIIGGGVNIGGGGNA